MSFAQVEPRRVHRQRRHRQRHRLAARRSRPRGSCCGRPTAHWEARVIVTGERARDGDYSLNDVAALRANPFHAARDFEGFANRDVFGTTIQARRTGGPVVFSSTTGIRQLEDAGRDRPRLHAAAAHHARQHREGLPVHAGGPLRLGRQRADPAVATAPGCAGRPACSSSRRPTSRTRSTTTRRSWSRRSRSASTRRGPRSTTSASACSARARSRFNDRLDLTAGARVDYEDKSATLETFFDPPIAPAARRSTPTRASRTSRRRWRSAYRLQPDKTRLRDGRPRLQGRRLQLRRRRPAARPTARSRPGTSKAA